MNYKNQGRKMRSVERLRVGTKVLIPWGGDPVEGVIVEDRGFIGRGGRRLWGIKFFFDLPEALYGEFGEDQFTVLKDAPSPKKPGGSKS
jgi:hypothetical protein